MEGADVAGSAQAEEPPGVCEGGVNGSGGVGGHLGTLPSRAYSPPTSLLAHPPNTPPPIAFYPLEAYFTMGPWHIGGMTLGISLCIQPKYAPHHQQNYHGRHPQPYCQPPPTNAFAYRRQTK